MAIPKSTPTQSQAAEPHVGAGIAEAARTRPFWLLLAVYAICGLGDFFVSTHVVAFAQDRGVNVFLAGNLLALMGLTGLIGVVAGGAMSDRVGPGWPTAFCFVARVAVFALVLVDQSEGSLVLFALVFGATFLVTAPLAVVFVVERFGNRHLGALTGLITMVHQICGGIGAYLRRRCVRRHRQLQRRLRRHAHALANRATADIAVAQVALFCNCGLTN